MNPDSSNELEVISMPPSPGNIATEQRKGTSTQIEAASIRGISFPSAVSGLAERDPRFLRNEAAATLFVAQYSDVCAERDRYRQESDAAKVEISSLREAALKKDATIADLEKEGKIAKRDGNIKAFMIFLGVSIFGIGYSNLSNNAGFVLMIAGGIITIVGWLANQIFTK